MLPILRPRLCLRHLAIVALTGACARGQTEADPYPAVLDLVPDLRGRAACTLDSIATRITGVATAHCTLGEGVTIAVHGDTVFSVERKLQLPAPDTGQALLDYWNRHLRQDWEKRFGGRPDALNSDGQHATRLEAVWNTAPGVRHLFSLQRPQGGSLQLEVLAVDSESRTEPSRRSHVGSCFRSRCGLTRRLQRTGAQGSGLTSRGRAATLVGGWRGRSVP